MPNYVPGAGSFFAKMMVIGAYPGKEEDEQGIPMVGPNGQLTAEMLNSAGGKWNEVYKTNVYKYRAPFNDVQKYDMIGVSVSESIRKLWDDEIYKIKPNVILALGDEALEATTGHTGIMNYRGSILRGNDGVTKVVPTILPAALFNRYQGGEQAGGLDYIYRKLIQSDIQRAVDESHFADFRSIPNRQLDIAHSSLDVFRFFNEYDKLTKAASDIESINCIPVCISFACNKHHSISIPLIGKIGPHALTDMSRRELIECWKMIDKALRKYKLIGQNFGYDEYKLNQFGFHGMRLLSDTLLKAHTIFPELPDKRLATLLSLWTNEPYYKDDGKENKIGKKFDVTQFFKYNARDGACTFELDDEMETDLVSMGKVLHLPLVDFYYNYVMKKHSFYLKMQNNGFRVDHDRQQELKIKYTQMKYSVHEKLTALVGYDVNVKSYPQMYELLYTAMKFKKFKKDPTGEDTLVALMGNHCKGKDAQIKKDILSTVLEERRVRDQLSRQINFEPDYDGRCKTSVKITGTETARTSTNILKKPIRPKKMGLAFHTISKHGRLAHDIRSMFIPDEGKVFVELDAAQAEARIVAVLSDDFDLLTAFDTVDIHRRTAGLFFGYIQSLVLTQGKIPIVDDLEKDGPERFTGKMFRHAGNYDMGKNRAMKEFNTAAQKHDIKMDISEWKAGEFIRLFHEASPKIRRVFHAEIRRALDNQSYLVNPFGRPRVFNGRKDDDLYKEGYAQIPQSTVADLVQGAALLIDDEFNGDAQIMFIAENHDALVIQAPINGWEPYAKVMKKHMERAIDFSMYCTIKRDFKLVIPTDTQISMTSDGRVTNYGELYKVKV